MSDISVKQLILNHEKAFKADVAGDIEAVMC